jgi:hypothetical protein
MAQQDKSRERMKTDQLGAHERSPRTYAAGAGSPKDGGRRKASSKSQLETRLRRARIETERANSPPPSLSPPHRRPPPAGAEDETNALHFQPIGVHVRKKNTAKSERAQFTDGRDRREESSHLDTVPLPTKKNQVRQKKGGRPSGRHEKRSIGVDGRRNDNGSDGDDSSQHTYVKPKGGTKPRTKDGLFSWLP